MTDQNNQEIVSPQVPEAIIHTGKSFSIVWIVPLVAVIIGGWLVYKALSEKGPVITITFNTAEGLDAGKTKIKYKDVEIGQVDSITLTDDLAQVIVTSKLVKGTESYLTDKTRFWVVRARVSGGEVSGLGTLFGGAYIAIDPVKEGTPLREFIGLERPPVVTADLPGQHFIIQAESLGSLDTGSPVYYKQIKVGQVASYALAEDGLSVVINIFIHKPHHQLVHKNTRFWNASGLDVTIDANGLRLDTQSLVSLMIGGIAFDNPVNLDSDEPVEADHVFQLHDNYHEALQKKYAEKVYWIMNFEGSLRGLSPGAPVELRGIKIGQVVDMELELEMGKSDFLIPVLIEIEPERFINVNETPSPSERRKFLDSLVAKGLRAQLKTGNLITGKLFVDLDFHPSPPNQQIVWNDRYPEFPTVQSPLDELSDVMAKIIDNLESLSIEEIGKDVHSVVLNLNQAIIDVRTLLKKFETEVEPEVKATLVQTRKTLATAEKMLSSDSPLNQEAQRALKELAGAARSIRVLADFLERHPDALLYGKGDNQ